LALVAGDQVEVLDPYWLFASCDATAEPPRRPLCAMPLGDAWTDKMLRPLVESLGYEVVSAEEGVEADLFIAGPEAPLPAAPPGAQVLRLRATPEPAGERDTIYRYDKEALLSALGRTGKAARNG
jgi:two-component system, chemotaxis family, sensor kinase CheA